MKNSMENFIFYFVIAFIFICFLVVSIGWATAIKAFLPSFKKIWLQPKKSDNSLENKVFAAKNYNCNHCGAALGDDADVSPSGDAKCRYCHKWFNIYKNA